MSHYTIEGIVLAILVLNGLHLISIIWSNRYKLSFLHHLIINYCVGIEFLFNNRHTTTSTIRHITQRCPQACVSRKA